MKVQSYRKMLLFAAAVVLIACLCAVAYSTGSFLAGGRNTAARQTTYLLKEYQQQIGVFHPGEDTPLQILDVYVATLPYADQIRLKEGIPAESEVELQALIEDYES